MVSEFNFIKLEEVLSRVLRHPLMQDMDYETGIQYTVDFIRTLGIPKIYVEKEICLKIEDYRTLLPCDVVVINSVYDPKYKVYLRSMSSSVKNASKGTYKTQGRILYTSFKEGEVKINYKAIPVDDNGIPLLPDHPVFLKALELYIKKEWFTILFDMNKISQNVLQNTQQEYAFKVAQCNNLFIIPSVAEMQTLTNMFNTLLPSNKEFESGFRNLGTKEELKRNYGN